MKPQRFLKSYKCDCFQPDNFCNCASKKISSEVLIENIADTAESLIEVMNLCGIKQVKRNALLDVITYYFLHFEEILHRIDAVPRKRLNKADLMHDLGRRCDLIRRESQMAFSIIKRAFKAFYHGSGQGGVPARFKHKLTHSAECLWVHAAQRTAEVCASYEGMFYATQKDLECKIKLVYKQLYDRITDRLPNIEDNECMCEKCFKRIKKETLNPNPSTCDFHAQSDPHAALFLREQEQLMGEQSVENGDHKSNGTAAKDKIPCTCPSLSMSEHDYMHRKVAESNQYAATKEPFECRWVSVSKEEFEADENSMNTRLPEQVPCYSCQPNEERDSECECESPFEDCTCETDTNSDLRCDAEEIEVEE